MIGMDGKMVPLNQPSDSLVNCRLRGSGAGGMIDVAAQQNGQRAPDQQRHHHHGGDLHDAQRLAARFVHALDVLPPEVHRDENGEEGGKIVHVERERLAQHLRDLIQQMAQILARADHADGSGENVVEHQRRNRKPRHEGPHAVLHHDVHAAAHEHAAAFHVDRAHGEAEQHHAQHEPGRRGADGRLGDAAGVKRGRGQIGKNDGCAAPKADEGKSDGGGHHDLGGGG